MSIREFLRPGYGKIKLKDTELTSYKTATLNLITGNESGFLVLDIDNPTCENAKKLLNERITESDCLVYSSKYTRNDVMNGKCNYKVIYKYKGEKIPKKKYNKDIEVFYNSKYDVAIRGKRDDNYEYVITGKPQEVSYDINDYLQAHVPFDYLGTKKRKTVKKEVKLKEETKETEKVEVIEDSPVDFVEANEPVSIDEFRKVVGLFVELPGVITQKNDTLLTFSCLFPERHTSKNFAYAFKRNGVYVCRCQGMVCEPDYRELNAKVYNYTKSSMKLSGQEGFPEDLDKNGVNVYVAPTGYGKTNAIVGEMINAINNKNKTLIILQSKEAIVRLLNRFDELTDRKLETMLNLQKIYIYDSDHKDKEEHEQKVDRADVIISHHYYFINAGNLLTYFNDSWEMLARPNLKVIIDEAHSFIEMASRIDLEVGGLYEPEPKLDENTRTSYKFSIKSLKQDTMQTLMEQEKLVFRTDCIESDMSGYGTVSLKRAYRLYDGVPQMDIYKTIKSRFKLISKSQEKELFYEYYVNPEVKPMKPNAIDNTSNALNLLLDSADSCTLSLNIGDDIGRRKIGTLSLALYHHKLLERVLTTPKKVILTTATMDEYHYKILDTVCKVNKYCINDKIQKATHIVLLRNDDVNSSRARQRVLECTSDLNAKALMFMPTIDKAKEVIKKFPNMMLNDNDLYCVGKRKNSLDYVDNIERNVTVAGLESGVSKGYNFIEEIDNMCPGFELLYFDKNPISPKIIKKHIIGSEIYDVTSDYNLSTFAQAIGRAFRKSKDVLCIAFNSVEEETYQAVKAYLERYTTAQIHEDVLSKTNIKLCMSSYIKTLDMKEMKRKMSNNRLFCELYN